MRRRFLTLPGPRLTFAFLEHLLRVDFSARRLVHPSGHHHRIARSVVSGLTRVVERLSRQGPVERVNADTDGRGQLAVLTPAGFARLEQAYPIHLAGVRKHVMDHLAALDLSAFAEAMSGIAAAEMGPPIRRTTPASPA
jgi:hypothetical protein